MPDFLEKYKSNPQKEPSDALFPKADRKAKRKIPRGEASEGMKKTLKSMAKKRTAVKRIKRLPRTEITTEELRELIKQSAPRYETTLGRRVKVGGGWR